MSIRAVILGAGDHGRLLHSLLCRAFRLGGSYEFDEVVFTDRDIPPGALIDGLYGDVIGTDDAILGLDRPSVSLYNGLGSVGKIGARARAFDRYFDDGWTFGVYQHRSAVVDTGRVCQGDQFMAGCIVQPGAEIGANVLVNTGATIDHDCVIGPHCHIAPGAVLSGRVTVGARTHIGTGARVIQGVNIGSDCVIGAGAVVVRDVIDGLTVVGCPAEPINEHSLRRRIDGLELENAALRAKLGLTA